MTPEIVVALCTAMAAILGALVEHKRLRYQEGDMRERIARCEARLDAVERKT